MIANINFNKLTVSGALKLKQQCRMNLTPCWRESVPSSWAGCMGDGGNVMACNDAIFHFANLIFMQFSLISFT